VTAPLMALRTFVRAQPLGAVALVLITVFVLAAILAPWIAPHDPLEQFRRDILAEPSAQYPLGTDDLGRDVLSRAIHGARTSLLVGVATTGLSLVLGTAIGVVSGYFGRAVDVVLQRVMDAVQAVPGIVLLLFIAVVLGPSVRNTVIALTIVITPSFNRIARGETLRIRQERYVEAARATGAGVPRILFRHVLRPSALPLVTMAAVVFGRLLAGSVVVESLFALPGLGGLALQSIPAKDIPVIQGLVVLVAISYVVVNMLVDLTYTVLDPRTRAR